MKKMKLLGALALASCVMLSGCNKKPEEPSNPDPDPAIVINNLPEKVYVGSSFDLSQFVSLTSLSAFTFELDAASQDLVSVEGNVISILGEGEIKFTVKAGELSKECSVLGIRESRDKLIQYVKGVENNYTVDVYEYHQVAGQDTEEDETDDEWDWTFADELVHSSQYILSYTSWGYDKTTSAPIPGGFLKFSVEDEEVYQYSLKIVGTSEADAHYEVELGDPISAMMFTAYNSPLGLDFAEMEVEVDPKDGSEIYVIKGDDASSFAQNSLFMPGGQISLTSGDYEFSRIEFAYENVAGEGEEDEFALVAYAYFYDPEDQKDYLWSINEFYVGEDEVGSDVLDAYCVPEHKPVIIDYWEYFETFTLGDLFLAPESQLGVNGKISVEYGWFDDDGNRIATPSTATSPFSYLPQGASYYISTANSFWEYENIYDDQDQKIGEAPVKGKMAYTSGDPETTVIYDISQAETESGYFAEEADESKIFDDSALTFGGLRARETWDPGIFSSAEEEEGKTIFSIAETKANGILDALVASVDGLYMLGYIEEFLSGYDMSVYEWFEGEMVVDLTAKTVNLELGFLWSAGAYYEVLVSFSGTDSVLSQAQSWETQMESVINPSVAQQD